MGGVTALSPAAACWLQAGVRSARHRAFAEVELPAGPSSTSSLLSKCRVSPPNSLPPRLRCSSRDEQIGKMKMRKYGLDLLGNPNNVWRASPLLADQGGLAAHCPTCLWTSPLIDTETGSSRALRSEDTKRQSKQSSVKISPPPAAATTKHPQ